MGYYTQYTLEEVIGADYEEVKDFIEKDYDYSDCFGDGGHKWYDHEEYLRKASLAFPNAVIIVSGIGEEQPDMWKKWFKDGRMKEARAKIEFEEPAEYDDVKLRKRW